MMTADNGFSFCPKSEGDARIVLGCESSLQQRHGLLPSAGQVPADPRLACRSLRLGGRAKPIGLLAFVIFGLTARATRAEESTTNASAPVGAPAAPAPETKTPGAEAPASAAEPAKDNKDNNASTVPAAEAPAGETTPAAVPAESATKPPEGTTEPAEPAEEIYLPGSPKPYGLGLSPEAPPVPAAPGGRAPSFGTPTPSDEWSFRIGGRIAAFQITGIGEKPENPPPGYKGTALHAPPLIQGRQPFWPGAGLSLYMTYGNPVVQATVNYFVSLAGQELRGYYSPFLGPTASQAYLTYTPPAFGATRFQAKVGSFTEIYGGVGEWGWGIFGPLFAIRGYGELIQVEHELSPTTTVWFSHGVNAVPQVSESLPRGDWMPWVEQGMSSFVHHAHAGITYKSNYKLRLHFGQVNGTDEQSKITSGNDNLPQRDGRVRVLALESHALLDPLGHIGFSAAYYDMKSALSVNDGMWWGIDWTQGGREMVNKYLGTGASGTGGTGKVLALSAQYDFSVARILYHPRSFDGRAPDFKVHIAALKYFTLDAEPAPLVGPPPFNVVQSVDTKNSYKGKGGYQIATETQYSVLSWLAFWIRAYGENRYQPPERTTILVDQFSLRRTDANNNYVTSPESLGPFWVYSISPSVQFRSDWFSLDGIEIAYSRRFYSKAVDNDPNAPLDRNVFTIGAYSSF